MLFETIQGQEQIRPKYHLVVIEGSAAIVELWTDATHPLIIDTIR